MIDSVNAQFGQEVFSKDVRKALNKGHAQGGAAGIIQAGERLTGQQLGNADLTEDKVREGMIIGVEGGKHATGRYKGVGHVVQTYRDKDTGEMMVSESTSDKKWQDGKKDGVRSVPYKDWIADMNRRGKQLHGVDMMSLADTSLARVHEEKSPSPQESTSAVATAKETITPQDTNTTTAVAETTKQQESTDAVVTVHKAPTPQADTSAVATMAEVPILQKTIGAVNTVAETLTPQMIAGTVPHMPKIPTTYTAPAMVPPEPRLPSVQSMRNIMPPEAMTAMGGGIGGIEVVAKLMQELIVATKANKPEKPVQESNSAGQDIPIDFQEAYAYHFTHDTV